MAAETADGAFAGREEGVADFGGKEEMVPPHPRETRNGVYSDAAGDRESVDASQPLEGLEKKQQQQHPEGVAGTNDFENRPAGGDASDDAGKDLPSAMLATANGDHNIAGAAGAQDGKSLKVSEPDRVGSVADIASREESSVPQASEGSESVVVAEEEAPTAAAAAAVQASPEMATSAGSLQQSGEEGNDQVPKSLEVSKASEAPEKAVEEQSNAAGIDAPVAIEEGVEHSTNGAAAAAADSEAGAAYPQGLASSAPRSFEFPQASKDDEKISSSSSTLQAGEVQPAENAAGGVATKEDPQEEAVELSSSSVSHNAVPSLRRIAMKIGKGLSDEELKKMVVIPEYLAKDVANAIKSAGAAYPDSPPFGDKIEAPSCPIIVFVNSKSGGHLGPELTQYLSELISPDQVYDLSSMKPTNVITYGIGCLDKLAASGDECARLTRSNLRIIVAGGDGTVGWVLSCLGELQLSSGGNVPPVGIIPLGTGNDLSRSFGWGGGFSSASRRTVRKLLIKTLSASVAPLDTWQVVVKPAATIANTDIQFPHALHPQHHVPLPKTVSGKKDQKEETDPSFEGLFWNYFSIGMDAQIAYGFHHLRDMKPWLARGRMTNQMIYSGYGCTQGWFCTTCSAAPRARGLHNIVHLQIRSPGSSAHDWEEIKIPHNIRAVVILNLQSYAGGRKPWGHPSADTMKKEGFVEAKCDDGLLEIVGFRDGWHTALVMINVLTAVRICQAEAVRLELRGNRPRGYMQMDGEPWKQPLGHVDEPATLVEISKLFVPSMLLKR